ncbi:18745_t:CDS:2 [Racocetra persica]|uniref:18745_t:CDS:1 n=1 Tax=Racocetra persica TaxID=160502 RepID=A0ACA9QQK3_9GLOM|nr:18745_t:CDS:2 [Racocetra persica]
MLDWYQLEIKGLQTSLKEVKKIPQKKSSELTSNDCENLQHEMKFLMERLGDEDNYEKLEELTNQLMVEISKTILKELTTMNYINPRVDIAFKKLFGVEENKDLLISLVNSIVSEKDQVAELTLLNPYNPKNFWQDKLSILDIKAKNKAGKRFNIEIQISDEADYDKRALYY